ncbi:MAG TPA: hypothetical protein VFQ43_07830 [Nitrososphaera sp.]|nr:hypothetical protein [Nitrososphaera sp.]
MTFEELAQKLPNGFHDAEILKISMDFVNRSIVIGMNLLTGVPGDPDPERYRPGALRVVSPYLFFIEPPDPSYHFVPDGSPINASGSSIKVGKSAEVDRLLAVLPPNSTPYFFFLDDWNSCLYLAGASVEFSWDDGKAF